MTTSNMNTQRKYTPEIIQFVREKVKEYTDKQIAELINQRWNLGVTESSITNLKTRHNIRTGFHRATFPKGHTPINKGTKGMFNVGGNVTSFKKGHTPNNYRPVRSERLDKDGYVMVKVQEHGLYQHRWRLKHRVVWEEAYGPLTPNEAIVFKDGNRKNFDLDNLMKVTRAELVQLNKHRYLTGHADTAEPSLTLIRIIRAIRKRKEKRT